MQAIRLNDYGIRWLVVGLIALVALAGCKILRVEIDWYSARGVTIGVIELLIFVLALEAARVIAPRYAHCMDIPADLLLSTPAHIGVDVDGINAGDLFTNIVLTVEEFVGA